MSYVMLFTPKADFYAVMMLWTSSPTGMGTICHFPSPRLRTFNSLNANVNFLCFTHVKHIIVYFCVFLNISNNKIGVEHPENGIHQREGERTHVGKQHKRERAPLSCCLYGSVPGAYWNLTNLNFWNAWIKFLAKEYVLGTLTKTMGTWRDVRKCICVYKLDLGSSIAFK